MAFRIGILGGTFNPIHTGHLLMAEGILAEQDLDYVLFIPCALPPHKRPLKLVPAGHRLNMVKIGTRDNPSFKVSTVELDRGGRSYSVDTMDELTKIYKGKAKFFFIIGSDSLCEFSTWKEPGRLLKLCTLIVVERPGYPLTKMRASRVKVANVPTLPVSSTDIRNLAKQGRSIKYLVPENVRKYILKHRLYCG